ncbi:hypothetical protein NMG60_11005503 [Bertholletia excelsa]
MKCSTKPVSSPSRAPEKFPPPLMRFLRSNVSRKSRGRSRSSPIFVRRKNPATDSSQEPSSPKVTCIGQVRTRRSSTDPRRDPAAEGLCSCLWVRNILARHHFSPTLRLGSCRQWVWSFGLGWCRGGENRDESPEMDKNHNIKEDENNDDEWELVQARVAPSQALDYSSSPPKNALLLTRCRSAPYRSSSLAGRLLASPLTETPVATAAEMEEECRDEEPRRLEDSESERHISENDESSSRDSGSDSELRMEGENEENLVVCKDSKGLTNGGKKATVSREEEREAGTGPLKLRRSRSEGARLDMEAALRRRRRLGSAET